jgi:hypothetical protein
MNTQIDNNKESRLVINSTRVCAADNTAEIYEFVLNASMKVVSCSEVKSVSQGRVKFITNHEEKLQGMLFELNHVRVNPMLNNELILHRFKKILEKSGVNIKTPPDDILMAICYKPIGELSEVVRFYLKTEDSLVFLSNSVKLSIV